MAELGVTAQKILERELRKRTKKNPRFSLRRFASVIGVSHTSLSLFLAGKRPLSAKAAKLVIEKLELSPTEAEFFLNAHPKRRLQNKVAAYTVIDPKTLEAISSWLHYAILSLLELPDVEMNPSWIAKRLGVSPAEASQALHQILKIGLIEEVGGQWRQTGRPIKVDNMTSTDLTKRFHQQLLEKALESLLKDPIENRHFSSITFALDPRQMGFAVEKIKEFRRTLVSELEEKGAPQEVYNITVQLFPVSR